MSKRPLLFFALLCFNLVFSQEIKTDNSLTGIVSNSISSQLGLTYVGENSFIKNKWDITSVTNYTLTFSPNISENELLQRVSFDVRENKWSYFTNYQYNYSYVRKIQSDNFLGIGTGFKKEFTYIKSSISYAILFHQSNYFNGEDENIFRHSLRLKFSLEKKNWEIISEYYYQPNVTNIRDNIIYGTTKISFFPKNKLNFTIGDIFNWRSQSDVKIIHNLTIGVGYKFQKSIKTKREN
jgi:hypothetical protein